MIIVKRKVESSPLKHMSMHRHVRALVCSSKCSTYSFPATNFPFFTELLSAHVAYVTARPACVVVVASGCALSATPSARIFIRPSERSLG